MVLVVAAVGMPGCGKGELSALVGAAGIPVFSMGDMIRAEVDPRRLPDQAGGYRPGCADRSGSGRREKALDDGSGVHRQQQA